MSDRDQNLRELRVLLAQLCEDDLDAEGYRRIEQIARSFPEALQLYINFLLLHGELYWAGGRESVPVMSEFANHDYALDSVKADAICENDGSNDSGRWANSASGSNFRRWPSIGLVAAGILVAVTIFLMHGSSRMSTGHATVALNAIAELVSGDRCIWSGGGPVIADGTKMSPGQKLELKAGVARFVFGKGATVLVESPAKFELLSATSLRLERGNVAVRCNGPVKDFAVISPDASILDRGTSFAVHYDKKSATEIEVLEGAVEVVPKHCPQNGRVLEMGANASIARKGDDVSRVARLPEEYRFSNLIEQLWPDVHKKVQDQVDMEGSRSVEANFSDGATANKVDTFYGAKRGLGWLTPWVATGNPLGTIRSDDAGFGLGNPHLFMRFDQSYERAIAREYGARPGFDPTKPHVITWRWRLDGNPDHFGETFYDRISFYGNPFFRRNSWPTNSWLIGIVAADEAAGTRGQTSTAWLNRKRGVDATGDAATEALRHVFPKHWFFFDNRRDDLNGKVFDRSNMIDTGMSLKVGVIYNFAVTVFPQQARYDAAIQDDEKTVVRTGLSFRSRSRVPANVVHFSVSVDKPDDDLSFSLDSIHINQVKNANSTIQLNSGTSDFSNTAVHK